ncbi:MAG: TolC family protein [Anaerovoracaceae bacterium]|jgi:outer membrane protein TolC
MKKIVSLCLSMALILGSFSTVFATDPMEFKGEPINLSIADTVKIMTTKGPGFQEAEFTRKSYEAAALGQTEMLSALRTANREAGGSGILRGSVVRTAERDIAFYKRVAPVQFQADMNGLESSGISAYYGVLQAADYVEICKDDLKAQTDILDNVKKKFEVGMAAKIDVISAESGVTSARNALESAETTLKIAKMGFNIQMDYDVMQRVNFTDKLKKRQPPALNLNVDIDKAKQNRVEFIMLDYNLATAKADMLSIEVKYPKTSATYKIQALAVMQAEKALKDAIAGIEMDVRSKYMSVVNGSKSIIAAETTLTNAKEGYRIAQITYNAGMNILTDVQTAQIQVKQAQLGLSKALVDYDMAVYDYYYAIGAGKSSGGVNVGSQQDAAM